MKGARRRLQVELAADPASVPGARRFVVDALTAWDEGDLVDAAELVASELTGNAALHAGARFMYVTLERHEEAAALRVAVEDDGPVGADALDVRVQPHDAGQLAFTDLPATGRGLAIVAMLAVDWGVDETSRGKRVWADLADPDGEGSVRPPRRASTANAGPPEELPAEELPPGWVLVRLAGCPVVLSLEQDRHLDELVRELQLLGADRANAASTALAHEIRDLLVSPTHARLAGRRAAERARDEGRETVEVHMAMPREFSGLIVQLQDAVARADVLCEEGRLLTLASTPDVRDLRAWMTHEIVAQAERGEAPVPWADWRRQRG